MPTVHEFGQDVVPTKPDVLLPPASRATTLRLDVFSPQEAARIASAAHLIMNATAISYCKTVRFYEASRPDGEWKLEDIVGDPGASHTMGMAHQQYEVGLPDGARRPDYSHLVIR
jgi:hypothetical protein